MSNLDVDLGKFAEKLAALAAQDVYLGTSSWKYPGWCGLIYEEQRYLTHGKFSEAKFNRECLREYARVFRSVCVDAGYYQFPSESLVQGLADQVPDGFKFGFKVTDEITVKKFPALPRFGVRGGTFNPNFLNAELFREQFLKPLETFRSKIGPLMFEFSTFHHQEFEHGREFVALLDQFLEALPSGWEYGVEIRNKKWLVPEYFSVLHSHGVAHVFNAWTRMPTVSDQLALAGSLDTAPFVAARFLLASGRAFDAAVKAFQPYKEVQEINAEAREAAARILQESLVKKRKCYVYVNNRLEGCAPMTIQGLLEKLSAAVRMKVEG